jgi:hypothetical protein
MHQQDEDLDKQQSHCTGNEVEPIDQVGIPVGLIMQK